jgi:hypothetical protein
MNKRLSAGLYSQFVSDMTVNARLWKLKSVSSRNRLSTTIR